MQGELQKMGVYDPDKHDYIEYEEMVEVLQDAKNWHGSKHRRKKFLLNQIRILNPHRNPTYRGQNSDQLESELRELQHRIKSENAQDNEHKIHPVTA